MIRGFQWDLARQVERLDYLLQLLPRYAEWGYNELYLHLEDAVHYPSLPGIGRDDAYSYEQLGELVFAAARVGIRTVPIVNLLGHTQYLIKHPALRDLNELRDDRGDPLTNGQICPLHPRTLEVADQLLADIAPYCTAGKVHVGLDESFHLGKCPRCQAEVERSGLAAHFAGHVRRLHTRAAARGLELGLWADMLYFVPDAILQLPAGLHVYDWYYYPFTKAPRVEFLNFAERDLWPALQRQGAHYYGCPMNGAFRHEPLPVYGDRIANIRSWWQRCERIGAAGMVVTSWEPFRLALPTTTVVDAAATGLWQTGADDATTLLADGLEKALNDRHARVHARSLLAADAFAFAGYARWQINDRWDVLAGNEPVGPYEAEARFFQRLLASPSPWPAAFAASFAFRLYVARRDVFVRTAARTIFKCRRLLAKKQDPSVHQELNRLIAAARLFQRELVSGRRAARAMWQLTRDPQVRSHNENQLARDAERLTQWRRWLMAARRQLDLVVEATPVCGRWQLQMVVHNSAPAVAKVIVEQRDADGSWRELGSRHTIEFRASAARRVANIRREFTVPVASPDLELRVRVGGVGQLGISQVTLTDGCTVLRDERFRRPCRLGQRAPAQGLPEPQHPGTAKILKFRR